MPLDSRVTVQGLRGPGRVIVRSPLDWDSDQAVGDLTDRLPTTFHPQSADGGVPFTPRSCPIHAVPVVPVHGHTSSPHNDIEPGREGV